MPMANSLGNFVKIVYRQLKLDVKVQATKALVQACSSQGVDDDPAAIADRAMKLTTPTTLRMTIPTDREQRYITKFLYYNLKYI